MARVSIEERAAAGAKKLARRMNWSVREALGALYFLWHDSQELEQVDCTPEDIYNWLGVLKQDEELIISSLIAAGFISPIEGREGVYHIEGNEKHIENLRAKREAARDNGKRGGRPKETPLTLSDNNQKQTNVGFEQKPTSETETNQSDNHSSLQFSAVLCSTEKTKEKADEKISPRGLQAIWNENRGELPECEVLNSDRERFSRQRLKENPDPEYWRSIVRFIASSKFHTGGNERGWVANFDYLIRPKTHVQVSEKIKTQKNQSAPPGMDPWSQEMERLRKQAINGGVDVA